MSHQPERKEKDCLNCGAIVHGRYCHNCGQENIEPKETFWHLITHFVYDVTHFDGKFFSSLKYLLFKPGFLSKEYISGKRTTYLNPVRMYVFISAFFFLFLSFIKPFEVKETEDKPKTYKEVKGKIENKIKNLDEGLKKTNTAGFSNEILKSQIAELQQDLATLQKDTLNLSKLNYYKSEGVTFGGKNYKNVSQYDSSQNSLPLNKRDNWIGRAYQKKKIDLYGKYGNNGKEFVEKLLEKFFHTFPQMFFLSLPLFALILKLMYVRRRNFYYADHIIYSVHLYCATFIFMFVLLSIGVLARIDSLHWLSFLAILILIYIFWYQYKSMRNFYKQGRAKTLLKFVIVFILSSLTMLFLFFTFFVFSLFTV